MFDVGLDIHESLLGAAIRWLDPSVRAQASVGCIFGRAYWISRARLSSHAPREP
jgi:hypothetical protein